MEECGSRFGGHAFYITDKLAAETAGLRFARDASVSASAQVTTAQDEAQARVFLRYAFTVTATGRDVATNLHHYWRLRDGKVAYYRGSEDTALIASALSA